VAFYLFGLGMLRRGARPYRLGMPRQFRVTISVRDETDRANHQFTFDRKLGLFT
jgi:hypothetical protein